MWPQLWIYNSLLRVSWTYLWENRCVQSYIYEYIAQCWMRCVKHVTIGLHVDLWNDELCVFVCQFSGWIWVWQLERHVSSIRFWLLFKKKHFISSSTSQEILDDLSSQLWGNSLDVHSHVDPTRLHQVHENTNEHVWCGSQPDQTLQWWLRGPTATTDEN